MTNEAWVLPWEGGASAKADRIDMNIPNMLTVFRIFLIPIFLAVYFSSPETHLLQAVGIFVLAGVTDVLDGYIARKYNQITKFGTVMDPLADKLMLMTALTSFTITGIVPLFLLIIILAKEIFMIVGGILTYRKGIINPANKFGKTATFLFHVSMVTLVFNRNMGLIILVAAALVGLVAMISYIRITLEKKKDL